MPIESFEEILTGGHPNSLGRTVEVVEMVLSEPARLEDLYRCYFSSDEVVRLRTSNAFKRISRVHPEWLEPYIDHFLGPIARINQASTQWTLADLFRKLAPAMTPDQRGQATEHMKRNLAEHSDWIVLNTTMQTLTEWAVDNRALAAWLKAHLGRLSLDPRKSVAKTARRMISILEEG